MSFWRIPINPLNVLTTVIAILFEILFPILLGAYLIRRYGIGWRVFLVGALAFIGSQVLHIPFLSILTNLFVNGTLPAPAPQWQLAFNALVLGLSAGVFEETARWISYKILRDRARTWPAGVTLGLGHGGIESILVGLSVLATLVVTFLYQRNPDAITNPSMADQVIAFIHMPWHMPLAGAVERLGAISTHVALSLLVLQTFLKRTPLYFILAVLWHAFVDGMLVPLSAAGWSVWAIEAALMGVALINLVVIYQLIRAQPGSPPSPALEAAAGITPQG